MKIVLITQNEPFYLKKNLCYLIDNLNSKNQIVACVLSKSSADGIKKTAINRSLYTIKVFGLSFFFYYSFKYILAKIFNHFPKESLLKRNIPIIDLKGSINSKSNISRIKFYNPDLIISVQGNQIFKKPLINLAPKGCINLHTSLLPRYRGLMPTFWVLKNNEEYTGVSVFFVDEGIDSGPIIVQRKIKIGNQTQRQLISNTKKLGMECIFKAIELIDKDQVELIPNPDSEQTYYSFPTRKDVLEFKQAKKKFF